jgi:hypothetical protein
MNLEEILSISNDLFKASLDKKEDPKNLRKLLGEATNAINICVSRINDLENKRTYIPISECKTGGIYEIHSRNLLYGVYDGKNGFIGIREKFNNLYLFTEYHWDQGPPFGTVKPLTFLGFLPENIDVNCNKIYDYDFKKFNLWAEDPETKKMEPVVRTHFEKIDKPHGDRRNFEDRWVKNGKRLPDNLYPGSLDNKELFDYLKEIGEKYETGI